MLQANLSSERKKNYLFLPTETLEPVQWKISPGLTPYREALTFMEARVEDILQGKAPELIWLVEHPPLYTAGTSAQDRDLLEKQRFPVFKTGRGGKYTYHGPGQRTVYVMLDLRKRKKDVRAFMYSLEEWIIQTLALFGLRGERREERVGVWIKRPEKPSMLLGQVHEDKIAAFGIRLKRWVSYHGIAFNVEPDLSHYEGIVPCGLPEYGVTSLVDLGLPVTLEDFDTALKSCFHRIFGPLDG